MSKRFALITGASAGLGAEFANQLAAQQINLVLAARRIEPMQELADRLADQHGITVEVLRCDLSDHLAPRQLAEAIGELGIHVDFLINNAGSAGPDLLAVRDWLAHRAYQELMMTSVAALCHEFIPGMQQRGFGRVANVASVAGRFIRPGDYSYGPTKAYLIALSESMANLRADGVHVTALCPGFTHTDFHASDELSAMKAGTPDFIWYDAEVVVRDGLRAVGKGRSIYTSGRLYRWLDPLLQIGPLRRLVARFS